MLLVGSQGRKEGSEGRKERRKEGRNNSNLKDTVCGPLKGKVSSRKEPLQLSIPPVDHPRGNLGLGRNYSNIGHWSVKF